MSARYTKLTWLRTSLGAAVAVVGLLASAPKPAQAQMQTGKEVINFLLPGGYFLSSGHARDALGNPKFYGETMLSVLGLNVGLANVRLGLKIDSATDRYIPFTGKNEFQFIGPAARVSTNLPGVPFGIQPFAAGGFFAGHIKSERQGIDKWDLAPGIALGIDVPIARVVGIRAQYQWRQSVAGVNTDGFALTMRLF